MEVKIEVEKVDDVRRRLAVEVPAETVSMELERAYADLARSVTVPGFRRGHVPRPVVERMFSERVRAQVVERLMRDSFVEAVERSELPVVGPPEFETEAAGPGQPLRYRALIEVRPEVTVQGYLGIAVDRPEPVVDEAEVDVVLNRLRESHARLHPITDREEVRRGDVATMDYRAHLDGKVIGHAEQREIEIGGNGFPDEFDANLTGARVGDAVRFRVNYPDDHRGELAGKSVEFEVHVRSLANKELPVLDDDFAKTHGDSDTVEELRRRVREGLESEATRQSNDRLRQGLLGKLMDLNDVQVPRAMVARRLDALIDETWEEWRQQRVQPRNESAAKDQLRKELEPRARDQVKMSLLLDAVAHQEGLSVSDADVEARINQIAEHAGAAAERVRSLYREPAAFERLRASLLQSNAVTRMVDAAQVHHVPSESKIADTNENR